MANLELRYRIVFLLACLLASTPLAAGPLDRSDMGPRVNPATNDMLRVPGVVGMDFQSAMATLQQAGLNPRVNKLHGKNKKYAGEEGMVVKQVPSAGGMAMLGSSVSITVYLPGNMSPGPGYPNGGGATPPYPGDGGGGYGPPPGGDQGGDEGGYPGSDGSGGAAGPPSGDGGWGGPSSGYGAPQPAAPAVSVTPGSAGSPPPPPQWQLPQTASPPQGGQSISPTVPVKPEGEKYLHSPQEGGLLR